MVSANTKNTTSQNSPPVATNVTNTLQIRNDSLILSGRSHNSVAIDHSVGNTLFKSNANGHYTFTKINSSLGPFVDDGAPYSAIGKVELR